MIKIYPPQHRVNMFKTGWRKLLRTFWTQTTSKGFIFNIFGICTFDLFQRDRILLIERVQKVLFPATGNCLLRSQNQRKDFFIAEKSTNLANLTVEKLANCGEKTVKIQLAFPATLLWAFFRFRPEPEPETCPNQLFSPAIFQMTKSHNKFWSISSPMSTLAFKIFRLENLSEKKNQLHKRLALTNSGHCLNQFYQSCRWRKQLQFVIVL